MAGQAGMLALSCLTSAASEGAVLIRLGFVQFLTIGDNKHIPCSLVNLYSVLQSPVAERGHAMQWKPAPRYRLGLAWIGLGLALAIHVMDESLTGFLEFYNPTVSAIREQLPFLPLPTFRFDVWITGLVLGILLLLGLSVFAFRRVKWTVPVSLVLGILMLLNGVLHFCGSFYFGQMMPGIYSSPLLMAAAGYLLFEASRARKLWIMQTTESPL